LIRERFFKIFRTGLLRHLNTGSLGIR